MMQTTEGLFQPAHDASRKLRALFNAANVRTLRGVHVEVKGDCVVLTGTVTSFYQKQMATEIARRVSGVGRIVNRLEVP